MERNAFFDNAKLILIFLVVFGHMIQPFTSDHVMVDNIYKWFYTFHMPVFICLAGFFAKGSGNISYIIQLAKKLIIPYVVFQLLYTGYYFLIGKEGWLTGSLFYPHWSLWFLMSLFCWHILLIFYKRIGPAYGLTLAVSIGLLVGYFDQVGHLFSVSRTFVFFPFFLCGFYITEKQMMRVKTVRWKAMSMAILILAFVIIAITPSLPVGWLLQSKSYDLLGVELVGGLLRFGVYVLSFVMGASVLAWIPQRRFSFTKLGERTLYVYLLHGFIIQLFREYHLLNMTSVVDFFMMMLLSAAIVLLLSTRPVMALWQPFVECSISIFKKMKAREKNENVWSS